MASQGLRRNRRWLVVVTPVAVALLAGVVWVAFPRTVRASGVVGAAGGARVFETTRSPMGVPVSKFGAVNRLWSSSASGGGGVPSWSADSTVSWPALGGGPSGVSFPPSTGNPGYFAVPTASKVPDSQVWSMAGLTRSTTGRLYLFTAGQSRATEFGLCSGTVISSATRNIVVTAAHCMFEARTTAPRRPVVSVEFVPGEQDDGSVAPYGVWTSTRFTIDPEWSTHTTSVERNGNTYSSGAGLGHDYAFLRMDRQSGRNIQDVTGSQGVAFGAGWTSVWQLGYPTAPPFDGRSERVCSGPPAGVDWQVRSNLLWHACTMSPGSSGGAYLTHFDPTAGAGYVVAVNSVLDEEGTHNGGCILDKDALRDYRNAQAGS
jgi:hypothetical protein